MEDIKISEISHNRIRLRQYDLKELNKLEPKLHDAVGESIKLEVVSGKLDEIRGSGGWVKGRAKSPSRNIGKSGGFRFIYMLFRIQHDIYLFMVYDHRKKTDLTSGEIKLFKRTAEIIKKSYEQSQGAPNEKN